MRQHFPFFLAAFPETAQVLSHELTALLASPPLAPGWDTALTLIRQQHDVSYLLAHGWAASHGSMLEGVIVQIREAVPLQSGLHWCFHFADYLEAALWGALESEALGIPAILPIKMLRCAPGNPIWLRSVTCPEAWWGPQTTAAHRHQVDAYMTQVHQGRPRRGRPSRPQGFGSYQEAYLSIVTATYYVSRQTSSFRQEDVAAYFMKEPQLQRINSEISLDNITRWLRNVLQNVGKTWDDVVNEARQYHPLSV